MVMNYLLRPKEDRPRDGREIAAPMLLGAATAVATNEADGAVRPPSLANVKVLVPGLAAVYWNACVAVPLETLADAGVNVPPSPPSLGVMSTDPEVIGLSVPMTKLLDATPTVPPAGPLLTVSAVGAAAVPVSAQPKPHHTELGDRPASSTVDAVVATWSIASVR